MSIPPHPGSSAQMHVLVTGGAGYIGSLLTGVLLSRGYSVTVVDDLLFGGESLLAYFSHPNFRFVKGDVSDPAFLQSLTFNFQPSTFNSSQGDVCDPGILERVTFNVQRP